jgi:hypothetical protein
MWEVGVSASLREAAAAVARTHTHTHLKNRT